MKRKIVVLCLILLFLFLISQAKINDKNENKIISLRFTASVSTEIEEDVERQLNDINFSQLDKTINNFDKKEKELIKSSTFNHTVAVLSFGCAPIKLSPSKNSLSKNSFTFNSLSFNNPNGVTAPGIKSIIFFKSSAEAKLKFLVLYFCLNYGWHLLVLSKSNLFLIFFIFSDIIFRNFFFETFNMFTRIFFPFFTNFFSLFL